MKKQAAKVNANFQYMRVLVSYMDHPSTIADDDRYNVEFEVYVAMIRIRSLAQST